MKKLLMAMLVTGTLMSCGNNDANDGDANTDTTTTDGTNLSTPTDTASAPLGDTSLELNNQGTLSNPNTRTDVDASGGSSSTQGRDSANRP